MRVGRGVHTRSTVAVSAIGSNRPQQWREGAEGLEDVAVHAFGDTVGPFSVGRGDGVAPASFGRNVADNGAVEVRAAVCVQEDRVREVGEPVFQQGVGDSLGVIAGGWV